MQNPFTVYRNKHFGPPVVLSIPHAGRDYPAECSALARVPLEQLIRLEDRYVDLLAGPDIWKEHNIIVAHAPRLWIDLNRAECEISPEMVQPQLRPANTLTQKARNGLGLVPTRLSGIGAIWHQPLTQAELADRVQTIHRPYHEQLKQSLLDARRHYGSALLVDLHSMPPIRGGRHQIVIGDRFGASADADLSACARHVFEQAGLTVAMNLPYAGGHILQRHAQPKSGIYALQIEIDRSLYLDAALFAPGEGIVRMQQIIFKLLHTLSNHIMCRQTLIAAE